jgi:hypothetical protein
MSFVRLLAAAALALGLAGILPTASYARWDSSCNCNLPDSAFKDRRTVQEGPRYVPGNTRVIQSTKVVPRERVVDENTLVVHVRPVIRKDVVINRQNIVYKDIVIHRQNTIHRNAERFSNVTENRTEQGSVSNAGVEHRYIRGRDCNCGGTTREYVGGNTGTYNDGYRTAYSVRN